MIISTSRNFAFVHVPKCAGTSMTRALRKTLSVNDIFVAGSLKEAPAARQLFRERLGLEKHSTASQMMDLLGGDVWRSLFSFAFVREPLDRLFSL